jgi:hypothetical protein
MRRFTVFAFQRQLISTVVAALFAFVACVFADVSAARARDGVDYAVEAAWKFGNVAGVPISEEDAVTIERLVRCIVRPESPTILTCAREVVIKLLPPGAVQEIAWCLINLSPAEMDRGPTACANFLHLSLDQLPAPAIQLAHCIARRPDIGGCAGQVVSDAASKQAMDIIDKLRADGRSNLTDPSSGAIRNIAGLAIALGDDDYALATVYAGGELYKAAGRIVLKAVLPGLAPLGDKVDKVVDAIIQNGVDFVASTVKAAKKNPPDLAAVGEAITIAYMQIYVVAPCALDLKPVDKIREAACGIVADVIGAAGRVVREVADKIISVLKDLGEDILAIFGLGHSDAIPPQDYYTINIAQCLNKAANARMLSGIEGLNAVSEELILRNCNYYYNGKGYTSGEFMKMCGPLGVMFRQQTEDLTMALWRSASRYAVKFEDFVRRSGHACNADFMDNDYKGFLNDCQNFLSGSFKISVPNPNIPYCKPRFLGDALALRTACVQAMDQINPKWIVKKVCGPPIAKPDAPQNCRTEGMGMCGIKVLCNAPLPLARGYALPGFRFSEWPNEDDLRAQRESGEVFRFIYPSSPYTHTQTVQLCAYNDNAGHYNCSNEFSATWHGCPVHIRVEGGYPSNPPPQKCAHSTDTRCQDGRCYSSKDTLPGDCFSK